MIKDLHGQKFGKLTAMFPTVKRQPHNRCVIWLCHCDCGGTKLVDSNHLQNGYVKSCGCLRYKKRGTK
jgi:hypothetical protein